LPANWTEYPQAESLRTELRKFLRDDFEGQGRWGIKQPLTSLILPLYNDAFVEAGIIPHYVLCVRNPLETMASESKLEFGASYRVMASLGQSAVGSWLRYTLGTFGDSDRFPLTVVMYDDLLRDPENTLKRIVERDPNWSPTPEEWWNAVSSIRTDLRHNRISPDKLDAYPEIVKRTFLLAKEFDDRDQAKWNEAQSLYSEFETWLDLLSEPRPPVGKLGLAWVDKGIRRVAEVRYAPEGQWQTVCLTVDAPPNTQLSGLLYGWPFRAWIRNAIWNFGESQIPAMLRAGLGSSFTTTNGLRRLNGVFEPDQIVVTTPGSPGSFELQLEFLLEVGPILSESLAADLAQKLEACASAVERTSQPGYRA
jgi:hypothetical protein